MANGGQKRSFLADLTVILVTLVVCLGALELGFRGYSGVPLFEITDWRSRHILAEEAVPFAQYDWLLGWRHQGFFSSQRFNTIEYGIRSNGRQDRGVVAGSILAVGDSFTAGGGVSDSES